MADQDTAAPDEGTADAKPLFDNQADAEKAYKKLQSQLKGSQDRERAAVMTRLDIDEVKAGQSEVRDLVSMLLEGGNLGDANTDEQLGKIKQSVGQRTDASAARRVITETLLDSDVDWSDPRLEKTRELYEAGKFSEAADTARSATRESVDKDTLDNLVAAKVAELTGNLARVDSGDSVSPGGIPTDPKELNAKLRDKEWRKEHRSELVQMAAEGQISLRDFSA